MDELVGTRREQVVLITTGSQGEPLSALHIGEILQPPQLRCR